MIISANSRIFTPVYPILTCNRLARAGKLLLGECRLPRGLGIALVGVAIALSSMRCLAYEMREFLLYPEVTPQKDAPPEEMIYIPVKLDELGFNRVVSKVSRPTLMVYRPDPSKDRGISLVVCPGGGYASLVIDREGYALGRYFQQQGITVAVLKYRLPDPGSDGLGMPRSQQDALAAIKFLRDRAAEWKLKRECIGILGCSAGGHLAGSTAIFGEAGRGDRPDFVALLYPVVFMSGPWVHEGSRRNLLGSAARPGRWSEFSLEQRVKSGLPPFFIVHAKDDPSVSVENSIQFAQALEKVGVAVDLHVIEKGGHGFGLGRDPESRVWPDQFMEWLKRFTP
jgi:acetyl esterase/lipase